MFDTAALCRVRAGEVPEVNCEALIEIRALLASVMKQRAEDVLKARHPSLTDAGESDAQVLESNANGAIEAISTNSGTTALEPVTTRDSSVDATSAGSTTSGTSRRRSRARRIRGERS
jgi:hypothetical protein